MDPKCEEKINFLQKYVPFLANLIELLAKDAEKESKLAQMQLLYDLLSKPDNSVKIETLEKCEEVLSRVFGNADEKHDGVEFNEDIAIIGNPVEKIEVLDDIENSAKQVLVGDIKVQCENINGSKEQPSCETNEKSSDIDPSTIRENSPQQKNPQEKKQCAEKNGTEKTEPKAEPTKPPDSHSGEGSTENKTNENIFGNTATEMTDCVSEGELHDDIQDSISKEISDVNDGTKDNHVDVTKINDDSIEENSLLVEINETAHEENIENNCLTEDGNSQLDESDTFILPDDGETLKQPSVEEINSEQHQSSVEQTANCEDIDGKTQSENEQEEPCGGLLQSDVIRQSQTEMLQFKIISAESLATQTVQSLNENDELSLLKPMKTDKDHLNSTDGSESQSHTSLKERTQNYEDLDPLDPLINPPENLLEISGPVAVENGSISLNHTNNEKDDDDDDVLLIETRSSPICIDSDPDDEENMKLDRSLPIMPSRTTIAMQKSQQKLQRTSARKSTSNVMDTIRHIIKQQHVTMRKVSSHKKPKVCREYLLKKDPKALMETINLIDSDSDDESSKKMQRSKPKDDDVIIVSSTQPRRTIFPLKKTTLVPVSKQSPRIPARLVNKHMAKPATAQSNFLNAVNLQPAPKSNSNPASFSAQLSNKKVIIPNAFYGNPSYNRKPPPSSVVAANQDESSSNDSVTRNYGSASTVSISQVHDRMLKEWLEGFLTNFASPLQLASHACFVLLQRVLKYRFFQRLKETRVNLNTLAKHVVPETMDVQMLLDLRNVFLENDYLTEAGRRFCRFATNDAFGKPVALTTDSRTGKVTCRTRSGSKTDAPIQALKTTKTSIPEKTGSVPQLPPSHTTNATITSANPPSFISTTPASNKRNRKLRKLSDGIVVAVCDTDDNDYTPYMGELILEKEIVTERKKSLRTNRTKRKEAGFTYSEDHDDEEFEALAKKIEDKKREELRLAEEKELEKERERERKIKKTVAKKTTSKRQGNAVCAQIDVPKEPTRKKLRLADTEILGNADDDLLTPTWVEADGDDGELDSLLDFADEPQSPETQVSDNDNVFRNNSVGATKQDSDDSDSYPPSYDVGTNKLLKNTDRGLHTQSQTFDFCVHCLRRVSRTVHHYVNEHRSSEVFTSRLRSKDIRRLLTTSNVGFVNLYKGNQQQYAAHCIFCDKEAKFLLPYWFEHFTMHTGEYSFKCSGCNIRKPTRSLLTNHLQSGSGCPKKGVAERLYTFDTKSNQIEAHICAMCNYVQVHRKNVLKHLRTQHGVDTVSANHIIRVVLLQVSGPYRDQESTTNHESQLSLLQHSDEEENGAKDATMTSFDENSLMMQNDFADNDDLSFMICGMLDVQTNLSATGELPVNVDATNNVDK